MSDVHAILESLKVVQDVAGKIKDAKDSNGGLSLVELIISLVTEVGPLKDCIADIKTIPSELVGMDAAGVAAVGQASSDALVALVEIFMSK